jgi:hypothetical protein
MRFLMERAWGRAPMEIKFETAHNVNVKYTRGQLLDLLWSKYRLSDESRLQHQQVLLDNPNRQAVELDFHGYPGPSCSMRADLGGLIVRSSATLRYWLKVGGLPSRNCVVMPARSMSAAGGEAACNVAVR